MTIVRRALAGILYRASSLASRLAEWSECASGRLGHWGYRVAPRGPDGPGLTEEQLRALMEVHYRLLTTAPNRQATLVGIAPLADTAEIENRRPETCENGGEG